MYEIVKQAIAKGATLYSNVSGGKDGQVMTATIIKMGFPVAGLVHADLGRVEWVESMAMVERQAAEFNLPLHIVKRIDGLDMLDIWQRRMSQLAGQGKPFWSSSSSRYCTSDLKRDPIAVFYRNSGHNFIISCEGIRAQESTARAKKSPLEINRRITSIFYKDMTVEEAIVAYQPDKRLVLVWYPIFNFTLADVWETYGMSIDYLQGARKIYKLTGNVPAWWPFHPAYVYGNERVSCMFCVLGSINDLQNGARHNKELLNELISMEDQSGFTFKNNWSLKNLL